MESDHEFVPAMKKFLKRLMLGLCVLMVAGSMAVILLPPSYSPVPEATALFQPEEAAFGERRSLNVLLLGVDYNYDGNAQRHTKGARSDTIVVLRVEREGKDLSMLSIPRDLYVGIGNDAVHGYDRINAAHSYGGEKLAIETVQRVTGLKIDHYIVVKSDVVADLVDAIGGVPIKVEKQMDWDDNWAGLHIHLKPGQQVLNGEQAVGYCRFRQDEEGDFGRIRRQQRFLEALLKELKKKKHWREYKTLAGLVRAKMKTDFANRQLVGLAVLYKDFPLANLRKGRPEVLDYVANGAAVLTLAPGEPDRVVKKLFTPLSDVLSVDVSVLIKTDEAHINEARRVAQLVKKRGYTSVRIKRVKDLGEGETTLTLASADGEGAAVLRETFPNLKLQKAKSKGRPEATLVVRSEILVSGD
jgi:polyisoprenyl-teichoic acid--peptidoglycan teichoic acid transferase